MRFTLDHGHDAGGLQRHVFSEFGKGLPDLLSISAAADTLAAARALLKGWEPAMTARAHGRDEAEMLSRLCEIAAAAPALLASGNGGLLSAFDLRLLIPPWAHAQPPLAHVGQDATRTRRVARQANRV